MEERMDELTEALLEGPYWIADILPEQVPKGAEGQYPAVDRYFRRPKRLAQIHLRQAELLLRLNCYQTMTVSFDGGSAWERDPEPERFAARLAALSPGPSFRALFPAVSTMIDIDPEDTWMTVYGAHQGFLELLRRLAEGEGLFLWRPEER